MNLKPLPGRVLVELRGKYTHIATTDQKYDTRTSGMCIAEGGLDMADEKAPDLTQDDFGIDVYTGLIGKVVHFEEFKAHQTIERDGKQFAFVRLEDLDGFEDE